jgi:hypothetical protein
LYKDFSKFLGQETFSKAKVEGLVIAKDDEMSSIFYHAIAPFSHDAQKRLTPNQPFDIAHRTAHNAALDGGLGGEHLPQPVLRVHRQGLKVFHRRSSFAAASSSRG